MFSIKLFSHFIMKLFCHYYMLKLFFQRCVALDTDNPIFMSLPEYAQCSLNNALYSIILCAILLTEFYLLFAVLFSSAVILIKPFKKFKS